MDWSRHILHAQLLTEAPAGIANKKAAQNAEKNKIEIPASAPRDPVHAALHGVQRSAKAWVSKNGRRYDRKQGKRVDKDEAAPRGGIPQVPYCDEVEKGTFNGSRGCQDRPAPTAEGRSVTVTKWLVSVMKDGSRYKEGYPGANPKPGEMQQWFTNGLKHDPDMVRLDLVNRDGKILDSYPKGTPGPKDHADLPPPSMNGPLVRHPPRAQESADKGLLFVATLKSGVKVPHRTGLDESQLTRGILADMGARAKRAYPEAVQIEAVARGVPLLSMDLTYVGSFRRRPVAEAESPANAAQDAALALAKANKAVFAGKNTRRDGGTVNVNVSTLRALERAGKLVLSTSPDGQVMGRLASPQTEEEDYVLKRFKEMLVAVKKNRAKTDDPRAQAAYDGMIRDFELRIASRDKEIAAGAPTSEAVDPSDGLPLQEATAATVGVFLTILQVLQGNYDNKLNAQDVKRGGHVNIFRRGLYAKAWLKIKSRVANYMNDDSPEAMNALKQAVKAELETDRGPGKDILKMIDAWVDHHQLPRMPKSTASPMDPISMQG